MNEENNVMLYKTSAGKIQVLVKSENVWMSQTQIWELFWKDRSTVARHILNIYNEWELQQENTCFSDKLANVHKTHNSFIKPTNFYNLDVIFAVGYRVRNSENAIAFRNWATSVLKEFSLRGFVMDDDRLENWNTLGGKWDFDTLLKRVREIRFSEKQIYEKIKDLFSTSSDYDSKSSITREFFAKIQNKFVYAITWHTTAELIVDRVSSDKQGLWMHWAKKRNK